MHEPPATWTHPVLARSTEDVAEARRIGCETFYPQEFEVLGGPGHFDMSLHAARIGPVLIGDLSYGADVRIDCGVLHSSYHVNLPLSGTLNSLHGRESTVVTPGRAALYGPVDRTVLTRWEENCRQLCVKIDRRALEDTFAEWAGSETDEPVRFESTLDVVSGPGRDWADLVRTVNRQLRRGSSLLREPLVVASLAATLIGGLVTATAKPRRAPTGGPVTACRPGAVTEAIEYMHGHATEPLTVADIAAHCCVGVRTLQRGFREYLGETPLEHLRGVRLRCAHDELAAADRFGTSVSTIAHRWGFTHLGRFAAAHEARYGVSPSQTLRSGPA
ncbi:MAG TPA: AraC family transcriptional regulator [Pseudonocardia sp.]|nr:AraC family transcriptional regulator [Pseudonocardia sp.]